MSSRRDRSLRREAAAQSSGSPRLIVGVGASAGGLRAIEDFFRAMPVVSGCSYVVVQHLSPDFRSLMNDLLARHTSIPIRQADEGIRLEPDIIYLIPPKKLLTVRGGHLHLSDRPGERPGEMPIDAFLKSAAADVGAKAVAVVLSGTGSDGTEGVRAVHGAGGLVMVQAPETAEFDGMPMSAIGTGLTDYILAPASMPEAILAYARDPAIRLAPAQVIPTGAGEDLSGEYAPFFQLLKRSSGLDFSYYKLSTVERRIHRRASLSGNPTLPAYLHYLEANPGEVDQLYRDLLIGVTDFFRDPEVFEALAEKVYAPLLATGTDLRIWVAGCATGEEAYSHAILLDELARASGHSVRYSIFATDAHRLSLETAAAGVYTPERLQLLSEERRQRYFRPEKDGTLRIHPELRQRVVFAPHNLLSDPPFTKIDVVSCRNLLIYLSATAQERVVSLLHYSLNRGGCMVLGSSEGPGRLSADFEVISSKLKLFRKDRDSRLPSDLRSPMTGRPPLPRATQLSAPLGASGVLPRGLLHAYGEILSRHVAPGFIINQEGDILHFIGKSGGFLLPQEGRASENLLVRAGGELKLAVSTLLPKVLRRDSPAELKSVRLTAADGADCLVDVILDLLPEDRTGVSLVHVRLPAARVAVPLPAAPADADAEDRRGEGFVAFDAQQRRIATLEQELVAAKEGLQASVEELQSTNEELQAANEEMLAANEELQSTNEELHSVNEELYTVNSEFERKNQELGQTVADLDNLLTATDSGTLFLDRELRIRRFNPGIQQIFNLLPQDIGRSIEHIAYHLADQRQMMQDVQEVLETGKVVEREVRTRAGSWLLKRTLPFRGPRGTINGAVLTFTRIDLIKQMQSKLDLAMVSSRLVWWEWNLVADRLETHTAGWCILGYELDCLSPTSETWFKLVHPEDLARVRSTLEETLQGKNTEWKCEHRFRARDQSWRWVMNKGRVTERDAAGRALHMLGTTQDISERKDAEHEALRLREAILQAEVAIVITDAEARIEFVNPAFCRTSGYSEEESIGQNPRFLKASHVTSESFAPMWTALKAGKVWRGVFENRRKDGTPFWERASITAIRDENGLTTHYVALKEDITSARLEEERRLRLERQLAESQKMETLGTLAGGIAHDFNNLLTGIIGYSRTAMASLPAGHEATAALERVLHTSQRAAQLVRRILAFSRQQAPTFTLIRIGSFLRELLPMLRSSIPATIEVQLSQRDGDASVLADAAQFEQAILNICNNSAQAIGARPGIIQIDVGIVDFQLPHLVTTGELPAGRYARVLVADNGGGIDEAIIGRIFEPFFTTKPTGQGTGLGLSIAHAAVVGAGGGIAVNSRPGRGTDISLFLPVSAGEGASPEPPAQVPPVVMPPELKGLRVFVLDDEEYVMAPIAAALRRAGSVVTSFRDAEQCVAAILADPEAVQVLVTDQTMPVMTGSEVVRTLRDRGCQLPVILMSGFNRSLDGSVIAELAPCRFIVKPFDIYHLFAETALLVQASAAKP